MKTTKYHLSVTYSLLTLMLSLLLLSSVAELRAQERQAVRFIDLSLIVDRDYPCTWSDGFPTFRIDPYLRVGP
ncbi:MAG: hypothetical protein VB912_05155, partial [Pirellulaceae bacterium]